LYKEKNAGYNLQTIYLKQNKHFELCKASTQMQENTFMTLET